MDEPRAEGVESVTVTTTVCNDCSASTSGRCWRHSPSVVEMSAQMVHSQECAAGRHAWTPWLGLPTPEAPTRFVTICGRDGCYAEKQYDL